MLSDDLATAPENSLTSSLTQKLPDFLRKTFTQAGKWGYGTILLISILQPKFLNL